MLSICIPVYNTDVNRLVDDLIRQSEALTIRVEVILIDDCSTGDFKKLNSSISKKVKYISLEQNIGRAKIRNLFLNYSRFEYLLFIDNDSVIISENYLINYIEVLQKAECGVVCGGRIYPKYPPERRKRLRWKYGIKRESQSFQIRQLSPWKSFMTNNFLIHRKILQNIKFDERLTEYGHEDTLFGYMLKKRAVKICHIDNPVLNGMLEDNPEYLRKTESAIMNLIHVLTFVKYDNDFINDISILKFHKKLDSINLTGIILFTFLLTKPIIRFLLTRGCANLHLFNFYKLGILTQHYKKESESEF